jgi:RNA polymerase sigma-70 factor (ECF subfamily)
MGEEKDMHEELVARCRKGDVKAQYALFKKYAKATFNIAMRFMNNKMDADDAVQESFLKAFMRIDDFKGDSSFGYWLKRITINHCISELRKRKIHFQDVDDRIAGEAIDHEIEESISPELVHEGIKKLPASARAILNLYALEGYKHKEIARMLKISESTSRTQYMRAKTLLASQIKSMIHED